MKMKGGLKAVREKSSLCREFSEVERESPVVLIPSYSYTCDYRCTWKESKREQKQEKKNKCFQEKWSLEEAKFIAYCCSAVILLITMNHGALMI